MKGVSLVLCAYLLSCYAASVKNTGRKFPDDFIFGAATASYQIKGAWDADGKGESIWDYLTHNFPELIEDQSNGDIAGDSYHNYKRDVEMIRELGLDTYRFSISWPRILPSGFANEINQAGVDFYNNYINEMLAYNITPMATLYHWDLPQPLQELGGIMNPLFADWFEDYSRVAFEKFGDRVKLWVTFNEAKQVCYFGYGGELLAPMINATGIGEYLCAKNIVMAHARAYHLYDNEFRSSQGGAVGYTSEVQWLEPLTDSEEDKIAAELYRQAIWGLYADPIYSPEGGFPKQLIERVAQKSAEQGYPRSRLPEFTDEEREYVRGTFDFFGLNHYDSYLVSATKYFTENAVPSLMDDVNVGTYVPGDWLRTVFGGNPQGPDNLYNTLKDVVQRYGDLEFYITESGFGTAAGLEDDERVDVFNNCLESVLNALDAGINVKGYMAWSLMDNFEWVFGYQRRYGMYDVNFEDPARTRTAKKSAYVYKNIVKTRMVDHGYEPPSDRVMSIDEGH